MRSRLVGVGLLAWALQPLYIAVEVVVGLRASADYSFAGSTVSDLGNTACRQVRGDVLCSPWHAGMNVAFVWFGCTLLAGALLLGSRLLEGRSGKVAVAAWCVSGLGSIGVGLFPVNEDAAAHGLVALPIFVAQPLAIALMGVSLRGTRPRASAAAFVVAAVSLIGAIGFGVTVGSDSGAIGALERMALWPGYLWVSAFAIGSALGGLVGSRRHAQHGT
ncbi:DUF998 domain-containing protein [Aeromicrobium sp. CFBP 8757]|uniref:DUF998 domain-containing protein n=1 Tax=Aeromicrobium sp. CFBP 8757 TaxID=2775288 RepID=UPI0035301930